MTDVYKYPYDPNGTATTNLVPNEQHVVNPVPYTDYHYIIPTFAPFFKEGFVMKKLPSGEVMKEGVDYVLSNRFLRASRIAAKPIYGSITFLNKSFTGVIAIKYQTLGGDYTQSNTKLAEILANKALNPRITTWEQVADMPSVFPTAEHDFDVDNVVFGNDIAVPLAGIRDAISAAATAEMKAHIAKTGNVHHLTKTDIDLGNVQNFPLSSATKARAGLDHETYMTPLRTAQAILAQARGINWKPTWDDVADKPASFPVGDHNHPIATTLLSGFMSTADKLKLDTNFINVKSEGAIGDGTYHPVSEWISSGRFKTLADIQLPYPHVQTLSDSIDWAVIQGALNNPRGNMVFAPIGDYVVNRGLRRSGKCLGFYGAGRGHWRPGTFQDFSKYDMGVGTNILYYGTGPKDYEMADVTNMRQCGHVHTNKVIDTTLQDHLIANGGATAVSKVAAGVPVGAASTQVLLMIQRDTYPTGNNKHLVKAGEELKAKFTVASTLATKGISIGFALMDKSGVIKNWLTAATVPTKTFDGTTTTWVTVEGSVTMPVGYVYAKPWIQVNDEPANAAGHGWYLDSCSATHDGRHFTLDGEFALTDFTNQDAVGATPATLRKFSAGLFVEGRDGFEVGNMRLVPNYFDPTQGDKDGVGLGGYRNRNATGMGDEWDIGLFNSSTRSLQTFNLQVVGYWRISGLLQTPMDYTNHSRGLAEMCKYRDSIFQGMNGVSIRDGDYWPILSKTSNTVTTRWTPSHRFAATGRITLWGDIEGYRNYSGVVYDETNLTLTFTGIGDTQNITVGKTFIEQTNNQGIANTSFWGCDITDLSHTSRCVEYSPAFGALARAPGSAMEISGKNIRGVQFFNCSFYCNGPKMFHFGKVRNLTLWGNHYETKAWKLKPATSAPYGAKLGAVWIAGPDYTQDDAAKRFGGTDIRIVNTNGPMRSYDRSPYKAARPEFRGSGYNMFNPNQLYDDTYDLLTDATILPDQLQVLWPNGGWEVGDETGKRYFRVDQTGVNVPRGTLTVGTDKLQVLDRSGGFTDTLYVQPIDKTVSSTVRFVNDTPAQISYLASYVTVNGENKRRWALVLKGSGTEDDATMGGDFYLNRYDNAGDIIDNPFKVSRQTGVVDFAKAFTIAGDQPDAEMFGALALTGGTLTGDLVLKNDDNAVLTLDSKGNANYSNTIYGSKDAVRRWAVILGGSETVTKDANNKDVVAGCDFRITRYDPTGATGSVAFSVNYVTGVANFAAMPQVGGTTLSAAAIGALPLSGGTMTPGANIALNGTSSSIHNSVIGADKPYRYRIGFWDTDLRFDFSVDGSVYATGMRLNRSTGRVIFANPPRMESGWEVLVADRIGQDSGPSMENKIPVIRGRVMEIGKYIDFHENDFSNDFNYRLTCDGSSNTLYGSGHFQAGGNITAMNGSVKVWGGEMHIGGSPGTDRLLSFSSNWVNRFRIGLDGAGEGGNNGSNFCIHTYDDGGGYLRNSFQIRRVDGFVTIPGSMYLGGNIEVNDAYIRSDRRVKHNPAKIDNPIERLNKLNGETFDKDGSGRRAGIYAQDLQEAMPESVVESEGGGLMIDLNGPIALLVESVKSLAARVALLEKQ